MQAPPLVELDLELERIRCKCGEENLIFAPCPWYEGQVLFAIEPACEGCGAALLPLTVPTGCKWEHYLLAEVPIEVARAVGAELEDEVTADGPPAKPQPMPVSRWSEPHEASAAHEAWLASQSAPPPPDRTRLIENAVFTGVLVLYVLIAVVA